MLKLTEQECIEKIESGECFHADIEIGTEQLDMQRWGDVINHWNKRLNTIEMPDTAMRSALNEVFYGRGNLATVMKPWADNVLVLPTELKKTFMDELTGELDDYLNPCKEY